MKVIGDKILIQPFNKNKGDNWEKTSGGILYKKESTNDSPSGKVIAIGNSVTQIEIEDIVNYSNNTTDSFTYEGIDYKVIKEKDILYKE